ncbi:NAD-dependent epimerase/dehydratase family protein [Faecalibacter macacae]|uniref:NAD-dependent epimerase n=1 Tax=Faecalibacter macacae TaxID=1859289 RepID=A0A3L9MIN9_9FLAO|nr:NAD-dependent epimerase/dehydratase family protein [Faecalibacter macacae]RLZ12707.1 NAD-dependent epimerase [Faecalibacter macacae]
MVIGNGLIANQFFDYDNNNVIFFASGVSNSLECDKQEFLKEQNLIEKTINNNPDKLIVYFSTCSIYDSSKYKSPYVLHKLHMEEIIRESKINYLIFRVSCAVGNGGNPNLLMNYLINKFRKSLPIVIHKNASRNLIDVEDVRNITLKYIDNLVYNQIVNVAYVENFQITEIIDNIEEVFDQDVTKEVLDLGEHYSIYIKDLNYKFEILDKNKYLRNMILKYYMDK